MVVVMVLVMVVGGWWLMVGDLVTMTMTMTMMLTLTAAAVPWLPCRAVSTMDILTLTYTPCLTCRSSAFRPLSLSLSPASSPSPFYPFILLP